MGVLILFKKRRAGENRTIMKEARSPPTLASHAGISMILDINSSQKWEEDVRGWSGVTLAPDTVQEEVQGQAATSSGREKVQVGGQSPGCVVGRLGCAPAYAPDP